MEGLGAEMNILNAETRTAHAFANVESMTQSELLAFCRWNDPNGEYSEDWSADELRTVVRMWKETEE